MVRIQLTHFAPALALGAFLTASTVAQEKASPQTFTAEQLTERTMHRRAMEAVTLLA